MYFKRKIDSELDHWLKKGAKTPILITGINQCGKTESIKEFARRNNLELININFKKNPKYSKDFERTLNIDTLISNISLRFSGKTFNKEKTLIFFDEIQECPRARLSLKFFKEDGRYNVIASGSCLDIYDYIIGDVTPIPVGAEEIIQMKTMDFEEFLWANGYQEKQIDYLLECFNNKRPVSENIHNTFKLLFLKYACIGGFPKAIAQYLKTNKIIDAFNETNKILSNIKSDFGRRKDKNGNIIFRTAEVTRIQRVYDLIPSFLNKGSKRFVVSKIKGGNQYDKNAAIEYLKQSYIVSKVYNLNAPSLPLAGEKIISQFKLFPEDIGILTSIQGIETLIAINEGNLGQGKSAIYEALVFDSLNKAGIETYYFAKKSGLEIDFVISYKGFATLVEAKTKTGNTKSSKTVMKHPEHYGKTKLIKIGDYNVSEEGDIITIPHYLTFALGKIKYDF